MRRPWIWRHDGVLAVLLAVGVADVIDGTLPGYSPLVRVAEIVSGLIALSWYERLRKRWVADELGNGER